MYCSRCGKQIPDESRFCSYCGAQVYMPQAAENRTPPKVNNVQQQPAAPKKSGGVLRWFLTVAVAAFVFAGVREMTEGILMQKEVNERLEQKRASQSAIQEKGTDSGSDAEFKTILPEQADIDEAMDSCFNGALYQDGYVRYGMTRLHIPGFSLLPGEGDERDWLISPDNALLFAAYRQLEIPEVSFDNSNEEGMLKSYEQAYSDVSMIDYQKYYLQGFPVIEYTVCYSADGVYQYQGELIIFPREATDKTIRLTMFLDVASGLSISEINQVFDTLQISTDYQVTASEADIVGVNRITAK